MKKRLISPKRQSLLRSIGDYSTHEEEESVVTDHGDHYVVQYGGNVQTIKKGLPASEMGENGEIKSLFGIPVVYTDQEDQSAASEESPK